MGKIILLVLASTSFLFAQNPVEMIRKYCQSNFGQEFEEILSSKKSDFFLN